ncbi:putative ribonuclease H-like domain-containing protein [Tanacetum coccineum]|uniref:Ribonuclease H-like domain-containing protein n=1 Tax=Tanacetum coccineum TaxID=301880 RepID=A0ABQ5AU37_9ASTR
MRMRQYIYHIDHNLWDVIFNGDLEEEPAPTGEEKSAGLLLLRCKQLVAKQESGKNAKSLWEAIKSRFGGNEESKKMQKNVHGAPISKEDINQKFLRSLPPLWNQIALIMRNKPDIDEIDMLNLYTILRVYEIDEDDLEELDLRWQVAMLTIRKRAILIRECRSGWNPREKILKFGGQWLGAMPPTMNLHHRLMVAQNGLGLENQLNNNVKIIRCDNGTEFKNQAMNEFCAKKGIKREFSMARTPQHNGVAKRKNKTLIEAARTIRAYDDEDVGAEADFNNMDNTIDVNPIPTLRIHKDHPKGQILGDPKSVVQTRGKIQKASLVQQALILVDLPFGKKAIGTKWVFRNKRDERSIVVKNKARLVAQRVRQEGGIDYDEVFAHVTRIEAIRLFLAFASFMGFPVYQMDVKSAFPL